MQENLRPPAQSRLEQNAQAHSTETIQEPTKAQEPTNPSGSPTESPVADAGERGLLAIVGRKISQLRREKGLTQRQLALLLHVSDKAVSKWERAECFPDLTLLPELAQHLGVSVDMLLGASTAEDSCASPSHGCPSTRSLGASGEMGQVDGLLYAQARQSLFAAALVSGGLALLANLLHLLLTAIGGVAAGWTVPLALLLTGAGLLTYGYRQRRLLLVCGDLTAAGRACRRFLTVFLCGQGLLVVMQTFLWRLLWWPWQLPDGEYLVTPFGGAWYILWLVLLCLGGLLQLWLFWKWDGEGQWFQPRLWAGALAGLICGLGYAGWKLLSFSQQWQSVVPPVLEQDLQKILQQISASDAGVLWVLLALLLYFLLVFFVDPHYRRQPWKPLLMLIAGAGALLLAGDCLHPVEHLETNVRFVLWSYGPLLAVGEIWFFGCLCAKPPKDRAR